MSGIEEQDQAPALGLRERGKRQRAARILSAARDLLREEPIDSVTVEQIAVRAEVSPPTIFNLIGRRERLWAAIVDEALGELDLSGPANDESANAAAVRIVRSVIDMVCADAPVFKALVAHWTQAARPLSNNPAIGLQRCFAHGGAKDPRLSAELVTAGLIGTIHQWAAGMISDQDAQVRADYLVAMAFTVDPA